MILVLLLEVRRDFFEFGNIQFWVTCRYSFEAEDFVDSFLSTATSWLYDDIVEKCQKINTSKGSLGRLQKIQRHLCNMTTKQTS